MNSAVSNVAIAAASGMVGHAVLEKLVASGKFNVTILHRKQSASKYPAGIYVVEVDFESVDSLTTALRGQDAVVSCMASAAVLSQATLIDAAVAAGVKRFLPSEFGSDLDHPKARQLPVYGRKVEIQELLKQKSKESNLTYTLVYNSALLDSGLQQGFILSMSDSKPLLFNGGDMPFSATLLSSVGDAVVGVLTHLEETRNRAVYVRDIETTQNMILQLAQAIAPEKPWKPVTVCLDDLVAEADSKFAKGERSFHVLSPYLWRAIFDPDYEGEFGTDNKLLGIKGITEKDIGGILEKILK